MTKKLAIKEARKLQGIKLLEFYDYINIKYNKKNKTKLSLNKDFWLKNREDVLGYITDFFENDEIWLKIEIDEFKEIK